MKGGAFMRKIMNWIRGLFTSHRLELYSDTEKKALEQYIGTHIGGFDAVFHESVSEGVHLDIALIPPSESRDYYSLVTMGMGAHKMRIPNPLENNDLEYAELVINLPKYWYVESRDEHWFWPLRWMRILARLPLEFQTWLGYGHTIPNTEGTFADDTNLNSLMLVHAQNPVGEPLIAELPSGKKINFYTVITLYDEEMHFKLEHDAFSLVSRLERAGVNYPYIVDKDRINACNG